MRVRNRRQLAKIMAVQGISARRLAQMAGWRSHSYMNRLLSGEATTLDPEPAVRIAKYLGVDVDLLFETKASTDATHSGRGRGAA